MNDVLPQPTLVPDVPSTPLPAKSSALAEAVRAELRAELQKAEYVDFIALRKLRDLAHHGRLLVAVRNPMTRFEARASGAAPAAVQAGGYGGAYGDELYEDDECYLGGAYQVPIPYMTKTKRSSEWDEGPMAKHFQESQRKAIEEMLSASPLVLGIGTPRVRATLRPGACDAGSAVRDRLVAVAAPRAARE